VKPPNILLIHSDQHRFDSLGINRHPLVQTPNLDRLGHEGVNFTHAFTPTPICSPARASLLTGMWPTSHGCVSIPGSETYRPSHAGLPVFTDLLCQAGYRLGHVGRFHNETKQNPTHHGVHDFVPEWEYDKWRKNAGLPPIPKLNGWFGETDTGIRVEDSRLAWGANQVIEKMDQSRKEGKNFFVRWDTIEPHLPCVPPEPYASMYPPGKIPPWPSFGDLLKGKPYIQAQQKRTWGVADWGWDQWAPVVSRYLGVISLLDEQIGRLLRYLDEKGLSENTLVIYSTDHGDLCGGHGMIDKHFVLYDDVARVPLLMRFPGVIPSGKTCDAFVSHEIDLASTFLDAAGIPIPKTFQGVSLLPSGQWEGETGREDIFAMWQGAQLGLYTQRMVRDRKWKYIWNATAEDELYFLQEDPGELINRATDPTAKIELSRLRTRLIDWMEKISDPLLNPWIRKQILENLKI
jgi:arylsulfatase A-like enzyme